MTVEQSTNGHAPIAIGSRRDAGDNRRRVVVDAMGKVAALKAAFARAVDENTLPRSPVDAADGRPDNVERGDHVIKQSAKLSL